MRRLVNAVAVFLGFAILVGCLFIGCYGQAVSASLIWALACLAAGGAVGFLFGMPRVLQDASPAGPPAAGYRQVVNTNLEQISDWLTKILVGLGLTQLERLPGLLNGAAGLMASAMGGEEHTGFAAAVIVYFAIVGFFLGYLQTRLFLSQAFAVADTFLSRADKMAARELGQADEEMRLKAAREGVGKTTLFSLSPEAASEDPQKDKWGGSPRRNGRVLKANVTPEGPTGELFRVELVVESETPEESPLTGTVTFHLHPTFLEKEVTVAVEDGTARLERISYGAFTVGAECDQGRTKLELDLAELPEAPARFRER